MDLDFLRTVWDSGISYGNMYLGDLSRRPDTYGTYRDRQVYWGKPMPPQENGIDLFFAPNLFEGERKNATMLPSVWLYADLDGAAYPSITPTYLWETSPGNTQALWHMDTTVSLQDWSKLNRAMTKRTQADPGGWHASKLLRVPESFNYKRGCRVSPAQFEAVSYNPLNLVDWLEAWMFASVDTKDDWVPIPPAASKQVVEQLNWDRLGLLSRSMLRRGASDRSKHVVMMVHQLQGDGFTKQEVFELIWVQSWCKWRTDGHRPHMLAREISAVFDSST